MWERSRSSISPDALGLGRVLAFPEAVPLSRLPPPLLCLQRRGGVAETSNRGREANHEVAPEYPLAAFPNGTNPLRPQLINLPGDPLLHHSATRRSRRVTRAGRQQ